MQGTFWKAITVATFAALATLLILPSASFGWSVPIGPGYHTGIARVQATPVYIPTRGIVVNPYTPMPVMSYAITPDGWPYFTAAHPDLRAGYHSRYRELTLAYPETGRTW